MLLIMTDIPEFYQIFLLNLPKFWMDSQSAQGKVEADRILWIYHPECMSYFLYRGTIDPLPVGKP